MKRKHLLFFSTFFIASLVQADNRDLGQNSLMIGIGDVDWTISPDFHGTKLLLGGRYVLQREAATAYEQPGAEILKYRIDLADFQYGSSSTDPEYVVAGFTCWTYQNKKDGIKPRQFNTQRTQVELLQANASFDDSLGVDYYYELNAGRIGRF